MAESHPEDKVYMLFFLYCVTMLLAAVMIVRTKLVETNNVEKGGGPAVVEGC
jgi:hypothetical protein